jgi:putative ABC transport system permease protein
MWHVATRNLIQRKSMTALALVGLVLGVATIVTLVSISVGIQSLVSEKIGETKGVMVMQKDSTMGPFFSLISMEDVKKIESIAGVRNVCPRIMFFPSKVEGKFTSMTSGNPMDNGIVAGVDSARESMKRIGPLPVSGTITRGRFLLPSDKAAAVLGKKIADNYKKAVGSSIEINGEKLRVVGIFETGTKQTDSYILMPLSEAQQLTGLASDKVRAAFVEVEDTNQITHMANIIEAKVQGVDAVSTEQVGQMISGLLSNVEAFLWVISGIAAIVAGINIVNTMLMSIMEREQELGILRAVGWTQDDIIMLIMAESILLGIAGGVVGVAFGAGLVEVIKSVLGIHMLVDAPLAAEACAFALAVGTLGGVYPAWRASRLDPLEAVRGE